MLSVYAHEGEFKYTLNEDIMFRGNMIFVEAATTVVYGMDGGEFVWEFDTIAPIFVTDVEGEELKLTIDEEKELVTEISTQIEGDDNHHIAWLAHVAHEEFTYWNKRR